jgi:4-hydroxythreonine-4-phosphate dehydrogenase
LRPAIRRLARFCLIPHPSSLTSHPPSVTAHRPTAASGRVAVESVLKAIDLALEGRIDAIVTAPISKEAMRLAGYKWPGHTEILAERTGARHPVMTMVGGGLIVPLVTTHVSMADLPRKITRSKVLVTLRVANEALKKYWGITRPRIAVCGLNPHAGEAGLFGQEEMREIAPACRQARKERIDCTGPLPADVVFHQARKGMYDAVVAMYHDQANIPVKMLAFESGVNVTLGLPIIRTSPDHGTAFNIAGKGIANPGSMIAAIKLAVQMATLNNRASSKSEIRNTKPL